MLPFFSDLFGDRWQSIKHMGSSVSLYLAAVSSRERCFVQQKLLQSHTPQAEAASTSQLGRWGGWLLFLESTRGLCYDT